PATTRAAHDAPGAGPVGERGLGGTHEPGPAEPAHSGGSVDDATVVLRRADARTPLTPGRHEVPHDNRSRLVTPDQASPAVARPEEVIAGPPPRQG
ncbi:hypothetical protein I6A84_25530, partial [Frankia sp. CNm7]